MIQLRSRERALLRQGQLFEPLASSGPAAMVLAISRNLSCIPRRSPCPGRYPLPLASAFLSTFRSLSSSPRQRPSSHKKSRKLRTLPANSHTTKIPTPQQKNPLLHIRKPLHSLSKILNRLIRIPMLNTISHTMLDMPLKHNLSNLMQSRLRRIDLR